MEKALRYSREIRDRHVDRASVDDPNDQAFLLALLSCHPQAESKLRGRFIIRFWVDSRDYSSKCFYFERDDETTDHFSFEKCIRNAAGVWHDSPKQLQLV